MGKLKVLSVIDVMSPLFGGSSERVFQMSKHLGDLGVTVDTLTTSYQLDNEWLGQLQSGEIYILNSFHCRYLFPLEAKKWLIENLTRYDVVHIAKNWSLLSAIAAKAAMQQGIPYVFSAMGFVSIHNRSLALKKVFTQLYTRPILKGAIFCIAVTEDEQIDLIKCGVPKNKTHVIPNGIVSTNFSIKNDEYFRQKNCIGDRRILLFIGRMDPIKGVKLLLEAYSHIKDKIDSWCLVLVGTNTNYRNYLEKYAISLGLKDSVWFIDPIFGKEKSIAYHAAEIIVIPSLKDAMTIIAPEAAFCKKPVLITKTAGFGELVAAGGAVEVEANFESIASGLLIMCNGNVDLKLMGNQGHKFVIDNLDWRALSKKYLEIFISCKVKI